MSLPVLTIIAVAKTSQYLAAEGNAKGDLFPTKKIPTNPQVLRIERSIIEYIYNLDASNAYLRLTGNYLLSLCGGNNLQALNIVNTGGGGSVTPVVPTTPLSPYQFEVTASSFIVTDATSKVFPSTWIGRNIIFNRGYTPQGESGYLGGTYYAWDSTTATLSLLGPAPINGAAQAGEYFQIFAI